MECVRGLVVPGLKKGPHLELDDVCSAAAVGIGRVCCRQRGYEAGDGEKTGKELWGPKSVVNEVGRPRLLLHAPWCL